ELAQLVDRLRLAALEMPDEVPAEGVAVARVLGLEVLRAVLAHDLDSGLGERAELLDGHVLRRGDDRHLRAQLCADPLVVRADGLSRYRQRRPGGRSGPCLGGGRRRARGGST